MKQKATLMNKLPVLIYVIAMPVITGFLVTGVLTQRNFQSSWLIYAAVAGALLAIPVAMYVSRQMRRSQNR